MYFNDSSEVGTKQNNFNDMLLNWKIITFSGIQWDAAHDNSNKGTGGR